MPEKLQTQVEKSAAKLTKNVFINLLKKGSAKRKTSCAIIYFNVNVRVEEGTAYNMPEIENEQRPLVACITVGIFQENCYLYACPQTREAVIIDPGDEAPRILQQIQELNFIPRYILNTHGHLDHICAIDEVSAVYPVPLAIHPDIVYMYTDEQSAKRFGLSAPLVKRKLDILLKEGDNISFGTLTLEVLHTPGHTPGGICLLSRP